MKNKSTLIVSVIVIGLIAYLVYAKKNNKETKNKGKEIEIVPNTTIVTEINNPAPIVNTPIVSTPNPVSSGTSLGSGTTLVSSIPVAMEVPRAETSLGSGTTLVSSIPVATEAPRAETL